MMLKKRWFLVPAGIFLLGLFFGSLFDLALSQTIADTNNAFGLFLGSIAQTAAFFCICFCAGALFITSLKSKYEWYLKIILLLFCATAVWLTMYFTVAQFQKPYDPGLPAWMNIFSFVLNLLCEIGAFAMAAISLRKREDSQICFELMVMIIVLASSILVATLLKSAWPRPRYRALITDDFKNAHIYFTPWWKRFNLTDEIKAYPFYSSDKFSSFPSGHTSIATMPICAGLFLPFVFRNDISKKAALPTFLGTCLYAFLIAFSRILIGAHFLSDVSISGLIATGLAFAGYLIISSMDKRLYKEKVLPQAKPKQ